MPRDPFANCMVDESRWESKRSGAGGYNANHMNQKPQARRSTNTNNRRVQFDRNAKRDPYKDAVVLGSDKFIKKMFKAARQTGTLKLNNRKLNSFPGEIVALHDAENVTAEERWWENVDLINVDLSHNNIPSIPKEVYVLNQLLTLNLSDNKLTEVPNELFGLHTLKRLDLSKNEISVLPELDGLGSCSELLLQDNVLRRLPDSVGSMRSLENLNLDNNKLTQLPDAIGMLIFLSSFSLSLSL